MQHGFEAVVCTCYSIGNEKLNDSDPNGTPLDGRNDAAADLMQGGVEGDTYLFARGSGAETITEGGDAPKSRRWRHGARRLQAANDLQWRLWIRRMGEGTMRNENRNLSDPLGTADLAITLQGGAQQVVLANFNNIPGGMLGIHLFDTPAAGKTEVVRHESRRWQYGDSSAAAANQNIWRRAA